MPLTPIEVPELATLEEPELPRDVAAFLSEADRRVSDYLTKHNFFETGFLGSDFAQIYRLLAWVKETQLATGDRFCEWGSGFAVIAGLASRLGYEPYGIEYDEGLWEAGEELLIEFDLEATCVQGSFVPEGAESLIDQAYQDQQGEINLETITDDAYQRLGWDVEDFDVIFCFPWPNDVPLIEQIFERFAASGSLIMIYREQQQVSLLRKF